MALAEPSSNATFFGFPKSYRALLIVFLVIVLGFMGLGGAVTFSHEREALIIGPLCIAVFGTGLFFIVQALRCASDQVAIDQTGIWYLPRTGEPSYIGWNEVGSVQGHEIMKRLIITDISGTHRIKLEYQLDNFDQLRQLVLDRTAARRGQSIAARVFYRNYVNRGGFFAAFMIFTALAFFAARSAQSNAVFIFGGFAALSFYAMAREARKVEISDFSLTIYYLGWRREIAFDEITNIEIATLHGPKGQISAAVMIDRRSGRPLALQGFREGSIALYDSLRQRWQNARGSADIVTFHADPDSAPQPAAIRNEAALPLVFCTPGKTWRMVLLPFLVYAAIAIWDLDRAWFNPEGSMSGVSFWFLLLVGNTLYLLIRLPRYVVVSNDALIVQYTLWRRALPYSAIANISLTRGRDLRGRHIDRIRIDLRNFVVFTLANLSKDQTLLYDVLRPLCENAGGGVASRVEPVQPLTKLSMPYERPRRTASDIRHFPSWVAPVVLAAAAGAAILAPRSVWRKLVPQPAPTPDAKALSSFPRVSTGWAGAPVPIFPGETLGGRWNIDYKTGAFTHSQTDFHIGDSIAIDVTRVYLNKEYDEAFGAGMSVSYDMYLAGDAERFTYSMLVMPDGEHFHFTRTSPGTSWAGSVFRGDSTSGPGANPFAGSTLSWNGSGWSLMLPDRTLMTFPGVRGNIKHGQGALLSIEDAKGRMLTIDRDSEGNILKISSPHNAFVMFKHDSHNHIISATDSFGKTVLYDYDEKQRLVRVEDPKDGVTHYVYGQNDNLIEIVKPDGGAWLKIGYDDRGRVADVIFQDGNLCRYAYQTDSRGMIAAVDLIPSKGPSKHVSLALAGHASR